MTPKAIKGLYLAAWAVIVVAVVYFTMAAGYPFWLGAGLAWVLLVVVNGSIAYWFRAKLLRQQGEPPPPFLLYLLYPKPVRLADKVAFPRALRVLVGLVIFLCGAVIAIGFPIVIATLDYSIDKQPLRTAIGLGLFSLIGWPIGYVGLRLMVVKNDESLLRRRKPAT